MTADAETQGKKIGVLAGLCLLGVAVIGLSIFFAMKSMDRSGQWQAKMKSASAAYQLNDLNAAQADFVSAAKAAKDAYGDSSSQYLQTLKYLAGVYQEQEKFAEARKLLAKIHGWSGSRIMSFKQAQLLAYAASKHGEKDDAEKTTLDWIHVKQKANGGIQLLKPYLGDNDPGLLKLYSNLEKAGLALKDFQDCEEADLHILSIQENVKGTESVAAAETRTKLANMYVEWGNHVLAKKMNHDAGTLYADAKGHYERACHILEALKVSADRTPAIAQKQKECDELIAAIPKSQFEGQTLLSSGQLPPFTP